jgi:hypothetical protein
VTGNIDPIDEIADVARAENLWFPRGCCVWRRIAVFAFARAVAQRHRTRRFRFVQSAEMALRYENLRHGIVSRFRAPEDLVPRRGELHARPRGFSNLGEFGLQGTRHVDVLKLWLTLLHFGRSGWERLIEHGFALADFSRPKSAAAPI